MHLDAPGRVHFAPEGLSEAWLWLVSRAVFIVGFFLHVGLQELKTTDLSLWSTSPVPLALLSVGSLAGTALVLWPCNWHQRGDVALSLCVGVGVLSRTLRRG